MEGVQPCNPSVCGCVAFRELNLSCPHGAMKLCDAVCCVVSLSPSPPLLPPSLSHQVLTTVVFDARELLEVRRSEAALKAQLADTQAKLKVSSKVYWAHDKKHAVLCVA